MSTDNKQTVQQAAKQGNLQAIALLLNRQLQPKGITAKVSAKNNCLQIMLEAANVPNQKGLVTAIKKWIDGLGVDSIQRVQIYAKQTGEDIPAWNDSFEVIRQLEEPKIADTVISPTVATETLKNDVKVEETNTSKLDPALLELAKNGDTKAISELIKSTLQQPDIKVRATLNKGLLQVVIVSNKVPKQDKSVASIPNLVTSFKSTLIQKVKIVGMQEIDGSSNSNIFWVQESVIETPISEIKQIEIENAVDKSLDIQEQTLVNDEEKLHKITSNSVKKPIIIFTIFSLVVLFLSTLLPKERITTSSSSTQLTPDSISSPSSTPDVSTMFTPSTPIPSPELITEEEKAKRFLTAYLDSIVNGESGDSFFCNDGFVSTFFAPRQYKILKITSGIANVRLDSSNKGGVQITSIWQFYLKRGTPKYSSLIGEAAKYEMCLNLISEPVGQ